MWKGIPRGERPCPKDATCVEFASKRCAGVEGRCPKRLPIRILFLGKRRVYDTDRSGRKGDWHEELFREELARHHHVTFWGKGYTGLYDYNLPLSEVVERMPEKPDVVMVSYDLPYVVGFNDLKTPKVLISSAFFEGLPGGIARYKAYYEANPFDLAFGSMYMTVDCLKKHGVIKSDRVYPSPYAIDTNRFRKYAVEKTVDVSAMFAVREDFYQRRKLIRQMLWDMREEISVFVGRAFWSEYIEAINRSKICVNENSKSAFVNPRNMEVMCCGVMMLADWNEEYDLLGFKGGEHLVFYDTLDDFRDKLLYYLEHDEEREKIAVAGMEFARREHCLLNKVNALAEVIRRELL